MPNHTHSCSCPHSSVQYCPTCRVVHCTSCNQEWSARPSYHGWNIFPYTWTLGGVQEGSTTSGSSPVSGNLGTLTKLCSHG